MKKKIPVSSPLFNLLNDLKTNAKKIDEKRDPKVKIILDTMLTAPPLFKERIIKLVTKMHLSNFKKETD